MKFEITRQKNGFIIKEESESDGMVFQENEKDEFEAWKIFLILLCENYGPQESRYSSKRIRVDIVPGDKSQDHILAPKKDIYCKHCKQMIPVEEN